MSEFGGAGLIFALLVVTGSMVNFDSGGTAAILVLLNKGCPQEVLQARGQNTTFHEQDLSYPCLSEADKGILGAAPYIGLCFGCPIAGELVRRVSEKKVVLVSLAGNVVATFIFALCLDKYYLWSAKFLVGLTQSAISIYAPVWVSKFAPARFKTLWYGLMQSSTAIGNLFGYAVCGYLVELGVFYQRAFQIQAVWLLATCFALAPLPARRLNVSAHPEHMHLPLFESDVDAGKKQSKGVEAAEWKSESTSDEKGMSMVAQVLALSRRPIYVSTVIALCGLYFTVSAVQYWASHFFISEFRRSSSEVTTLFIFVAGTAPTLGCVVGSAVVDWSGGYETPQQMSRALLLTTTWAFIAAMAGLVAGFVEPAPDLPGAARRFYSVVGCLYVLLFFGGAMLPAVTGISMAAVPENLRKSASSWSMLLYNVFGFSLGAYLPGYIGEVFSIRFGMQIVFMWALTSAGAMAWAYLIASHAAKGDDEARCLRLWDIFHCLRLCLRNRRSSFESSAMASLACTQETEMKEGESPGNQIEMVASLRSRSS